MKIKKLDITTVTYAYDDHIRVDITEEEDTHNPGFKMWNAYLYDDRYSHKMHIWGSPERQPKCIDGDETYEDFVFTTLCNVGDDLDMYYEEIEAMETWFEKKFEEEN